MFNSIRQIIMAQIGSITKVVPGSISVIDFGAVVDPALEFSVVVPTAVGASTVTIPALVARDAAALQVAFDGVITADIALGTIRVFHGLALATPVDVVHQKDLQTTKDVVIPFTENTPGMIGSAIGYFAGSSR